ncbi:hypothetical protein V6N13_043087 [Hibiscus sabdariffa]
MMAMLSHVLQNQSQLHINQVKYLDATSTQKETTALVNETVAMDVAVQLLEQKYLRKKMLMIILKKLTRLQLLRWRQTTIRMNSRRLTTRISPIVEENLPPNSPTLPDLNVAEVVAAIEENEEKDYHIAKIIEDAITYANESLPEGFHKQHVVTTKEEELEAKTQAPTLEQQDNEVNTPATVCYNRGSYNK